MHLVNRPDSEPEELIHLRRNKGCDFGSMGKPLNVVFNGVCAYCERTTKDDDVEVRNNGLFTCDHFRPRHQFPELIYKWDNLVYSCGECQYVKGGLWPEPYQKANAYINPCAASGAHTPNEVFVYDISDGWMLVSDGLDDVVAARAGKTCSDLSLNPPRFPGQSLKSITFGKSKARKTDLAEQRKQWVRGLARTLESLSSVGSPNGDLLTFIVREHTHPSARFSSICAQFVRESQYAAYL